MNDLVVPEVSLPALTTQEDTFCLAIIEYAGNFGAAYKAAFGEDARMAAAKGRELLTRPEIAKRIARLTESVEENAYISLGSHLSKMAEIRDLAITSGQLKVALNAEKHRGEVAGYYGGKVPTKDPEKSTGGHAAVNIFMGASSANVQDWSKAHGKPAIIIEAE